MTLSEGVTRVRQEVIDDKRDFASTKIIAEFSEIGWAIGFYADLRERIEKFGCGNIAYILEVYNTDDGRFKEFGRLDNSSHKED